MRTKLHPKLRWRVAHWLDRLPWTCWTSLVCWAIGDTVTLREIRQTDLCRSDAAGDSGRCYCSKIYPKAGAE